MKNAAIYLRVSTGKQAAGDLSMPDQERQCEQYAKANGFEVAETFVDAGVSARTDKRPEFQRMIKLACAPHRPFDVILVHSQSRFTRNTKDLLVYKELLDENGVALVSITQDLGEGETAEIMHTIVGALDEYQSKETAKHVSRSMIENARQGYWNGSKPPFGYKTFAAETRGARVKKKIEIDEHEAEIVRLIFRLYVFGPNDVGAQSGGSSGPLGVKRTATYLNERGFRTRTGRTFLLQYVDKILRNTAYVGEYHFNKTDSRRKVDRSQVEWVAFAMPCIVDDATFYTAQEKLDRQHPLKTAPRLVRSSVLLTSVAKCGECGAPMRKQTGKNRQYHYYRCSKKSDAGKTACKGVSIPMAELDDIVLTTLEETVFEPNRLRRMTQALVARASEKNEVLGARLNALDGDKRRIKKSVDTLYKHIGDGTIEMEPTLERHIKDLQDRYATLKQQVAHLERERSLPMQLIDRGTVDRFSRAAKDALRNQDNREFARAYVQAIVSDVTVTDDEVHIKGPRAALAQQTAAFAAKGELVPSFAQEWRAREDSNL